MSKSAQPSNFCVGSKLRNNRLLFDQNRLLATTRSATQTKTWTDYAQINPLLDRAISLMVLTPVNGLKIPIGRAKALADDDFSKYIKGIYYDDCTRNIDEVLRECAERVAYILESNSW